MNFVAFMQIPSLLLLLFLPCNLLHDLLTTVVTFLCIIEHRQPAEIEKVLVPSWNSLVFFEVTPVSFHQVNLWNSLTNPPYMYRSVCSCMVI